MNMFSNLNRHNLSCSHSDRSKKEGRTFMGILFFALLFLSVSFTAQAYTLDTLFVRTDTLPAHGDSLSLDRDSLLAGTTR